MGERRNMTICRSIRRRGADKGTGGFTIIEMMVTVMILGMMIAAFSVVIVQCNRVVSAAQIIMRSNAKIAAITQVLRRDIRRVTKGGIMAITQTTAGSPALVVTTAEPMTTVQSATDCLGSYVVYGLRANQADYAREAILWRPEYGFATEGRLTPADVMGIRLGPGDNSVLGKIQAYSRAEASSEVTSLVATGGNSLYMPPDTLVQINNIWQVLTEGCSELTIMWTDGSLDQSTGATSWYGAETLPDGTGVVRAKSDSWRSASIASGEVEFAATGGYRAMWTADNIGDWPRAVMVRFRLTDSNLPEGMSAELYEIICEVAP